MNRTNSAIALRTIYAVASGASFALCMSVLAYSGPYRLFIRSSLGDVLAVIFLYFLLATVRPGSILFCAAITGTVAVGIELAQLAGITPPDAHWLVKLLFGSHFDIWDILAYAAGIAIAVAIDYAIIAYSRRANNTPKEML